MSLYVLLSVICFAYPVVYFCSRSYYRVDEMAVMCSSRPKLQVKNKKRVKIISHLRKNCSGIGWSSNTVHSTISFMLPAFLAFTIVTAPSFLP